MRARVTGRAAFPVIDERSSVGRGALVSPDDLARLATDAQRNDDLVVTWAAGVDADRANGALSRRVGTQVLPPTLPSDVNNLVDVEVLPQVLAAFLAVLATLAAVHALVSTVRVRRRDLAVLRTIGFERRQLAVTLAWQGTTIAAVGLVIGVPLGLVVGRLVWREVAEAVGVLDHPAVPVAAVAHVVGAALVVANLAAALPARGARRVAPAAVLRAG